MKHRITFEVDNMALFDMIRKAGNDFSAIGERVIGVMMVPDNVAATTHIGMAFYGVTLVGYEEIASEDASKVPSK